MSKYLRHLKTITRHKYYVMKACFACGLIWRGLVHDLSKYAPVEFFASARYFQGNSSPIDAEKTAKGYSIAWQNHKAKNKHHWQYWTDFERGGVFAIKMSTKYLAEMLCDWVGAGKAYNKENWTIDTFKGWYLKHKDEMLLHDDTRQEIESIMIASISEKQLYENISIINKTGLRDVFLTRKEAEAALAAEKESSHE